MKFSIFAPLLLTVAPLGLCAPAAVPTTEVAGLDAAQVEQFQQAVQLLAGLHEKRQVDMSNPFNMIYQDNPLGRVMQQATALGFKAGDFILNVPLDAAYKMMSGHPDQAVADAMKTVVSTMGGLPKDAESLIKAMGPIQGN